MEKANPVCRCDDSVGIQRGYHKEGVKTNMHMRAFEDIAK